jgi:hypothetical protein
MASSWSSTARVGAIRISWIRFTSTLYDCYVFSSHSFHPKAHTGTGFDFCFESNFFFFYYFIFSYYDLVEELYLMAQPLASSAPMVKPQPELSLGGPSSAAATAGAGTVAARGPTDSPAPSIHVPAGQSFAGTPGAAAEPYNPYDQMPLSARPSTAAAAATAVQPYPQATFSGMPLHRTASVPYYSAQQAPAYAQPLPQQQHHHQQQHQHQQQQQQQPFAPYGQVPPHRYMQGYVPQRAGGIYMY